jgi:hypothetical protein
MAGTGGAGRAMVARAAAFVLAALGIYLLLVSPVLFVMAFDWVFFTLRDLVGAPWTFAILTTLSTTSLIVYCTLLAPRIYGRPRPFCSGTSRRRGGGR